METVWERRDCVSAQVEDALVLLDLESLVYHSLNPTAADVWHLLETPHSIAALTEALCLRYKVESADCHASVTRLLGELETQRLVAARP